MERVQIAVRALAEYAFRSGSIESGFRTAGTLAEGTKAHQEIQKRYGEQDEKERLLKAEIPFGSDLLFVLEGRCDGLLQEDGRMVIDEIKSTASALELIGENSYPVHWAQAYLYAYMYVVTRLTPEHGEAVAAEAAPAAAEPIVVQLTYVHVNTGETRRFRREAAPGELECLVTDMFAKYAPYARMMLRHKAERDRSIHGLPFPFDDYREGQRKLAAAVYRSIERGEGLFAKAPTGIGKTMSTLFPAVKAVGAGLLERIFYATVRTTTRTAAEEALGRMASKGLKLHAVTITAKDKICFRETVSCRKEDCEFADGYYDRINEALLDLLRHETLMTREVVERYARKHRVCPFEFSLDAAYAADAVIGDYNYALDPRVSLKRMRDELRRKTALLVDEAHNLPDRAREMISAALDKAAFLQLQRAYKTANPALAAAAKAVNARFIALRKQIGDRGASAEQEAPVELLALAEAFAAEAERQLAAGGGTERELPDGGSTAAELLLETYFGVQHFISTGTMFDDRYVTLTEVSGQAVTVKLRCLDPSEFLRQNAKNYRSRILFSATLAPLSFYMDALGAAEGDRSLSVPSPFSREQLQVWVAPLSTRYADRERTGTALARLLLETTERRKGNYLVFFPSYAYLNAIADSFRMLEELSGTARLGSPAGPIADVLIQRTDMTEAERDAFLASFGMGGDGPSKPVIGFAVLGGAFSEGIDLVGDRLNGVIVVGVGLPQINVERDLIKDYEERAGRNGFDYAYVYPGMNKVLQAGGRLIRSERDTGLLVLVDDRYLQLRYRRLLPEEWRDFRVVEGNIPGNITW